MEIELAALPDRFRPDTIFVGGGTPTSLGVAQMERLMRAIKRIDISLTSEFTIEANPGTIDDEKLSLLRESGVNRLSLGAQSLDDFFLKTLGRAHTSADVYRAVESARKHGFDNVSLDLIFAVPEQTVEMWLEDLGKCVRLAPEHVSTYCLIYEKDTPLVRMAEAGDIEKLSTDIEAEMYAAALRFLPEHGYEHYEISNFARPGRQCRHNLLYWRNDTTRAVGAGAFAFADGVRRTNARPVGEYVKLMHERGHAVILRENLEPEDSARETAFLRLRTRQGVDKADFRQKTGFYFDALVNDDFRKLIDEGYLADSDENIHLTDKGFPVADSVFVHLMR